MAKITNAVGVLMRRDGNTQEEAEKRIAEVRKMFADCGYDPDECESIMLYYLGLELDYLFDILW